MGAITVSAKGNEFSLIVPNRVFKELGLNPDAGYDLARARDGIWVLVECRENPLDAKILSKLGKSELKERVEGKFEKLLSREELARLREMLKEGSIIAFRLSPKYKRAVYKTREEIEKNIKIARSGKGQAASREKGPQATAEKRAVKEGSGPEADCLEKEGFIVCRNTAAAKKLSQDLKSEIESGEIRGVKGFDGLFYIAKNGLYQRHREKALSLIKGEKGISSEKVAEALGISLPLSRIVCELLKEEGEIIEKRKNQYQAI